jgi:hypothetical protein
MVVRDRAEIGLSWIGRCRVQVRPAEGIPRRVPRGSSDGPAQIEVVWRRLAIYG